MAIEIAAHITGTGTFDFTALTQLKIDPDTQKWLFLGFFIAFVFRASVPFGTESRIAFSSSSAHSTRHVSGRSLRGQR